MALVKKLVNITKGEQLVVETTRGSMYVQPRQVLENVDVLNGHELQGKVSVEQVIVRQPIIEVKPQVQASVSLNEVKPPKNKRGRQL